MSASPQEPRPGQVLAGKYRVERVIGAGGMGYVVAARHLGLNQVVALKLVRAGQRSDDTQVARFLREARTAAKLKSEHVVKVFDVGRLEDGRPFQVMELLDGRDLSAYADPHGLLPIPQVVGYVLQVCEALAEAHAQGIIHRDLKPSNLFLAQRPAAGEIVKVLDFGISKVTSPDERSMTRSKDRMGTPAYMSPEQLRSAKNIDARADLWSIGVILYELLSGAVPFDGETIGQLCTQILDAPTPSLRQRAPNVPAGLEAVVFRCLEKDPNKRYAAIPELAAALAPFAQAEVSDQIGRIDRLARGSILTPAAFAAAGSVAPDPAEATILDRAGEGTTTVPDARHSHGMTWLAGVLAFAATVVLGLSLLSAHLRSGREKLAASGSAGPPSRVDANEPAPPRSVPTASSGTRAQPSASTSARRPTPTPKSS